MVTLRPKRLAAEAPAAALVAEVCAPVAPVTVVPMPSTLFWTPCMASNAEYWASWAAICWLSEGAVGSWYCSCVTRRCMKSFLSMEPLDFFSEALASLPSAVTEFFQLPFLTASK